MVSIIRFENRLPLRFLYFDGSPFASRTITDADKDDSLVLHALLLPFLLLTAQPVSSPDDTFKPEYVLPQLLAEIVRTTFADEFAGVAYQSTRLLNDAQAEGTFLNFALFPKDVYADTDYCPHLLKTFAACKPCNFQLTDGYNQQSGTIVRQKTIRRINISGTSVAFDESIFARIEQKMNDLDMESIRV